jgi:hypothetical protein
MTDSCQIQQDLTSTLCSSEHDPETREGLQFESINIHWIFSAKAVAIHCLGL